MSTYEVPEPILNSPYEAPQACWYIEEGKPPERRPAGYFYRDPTAPHGGSEHEAHSQWVELTLVNLVRQRLMAWHQHNWGRHALPMELLNYWRREGRAQRLFFAQLEAVETIIFLTEARADLLQGPQRTARRAQP
jgi:type III restriction enzyme